MASLPITVTYEELSGSPTEDFGEDGFTALRTLKCAWTDRITLAQQLKGGSLGGVYYQPHSYDALPFARVASIAVSPFYDEEIRANGIDIKTAAYTVAQLAVSYRTGLSSGDDSDPDAVLVEESIEPFAEFLTLPATGFLWGSKTGEPLKDEEAPGKLFKGFNWVYSKSSLLLIPAPVFSLVGKVNSDSVRSKSLRFTFPAETLLYNPPILHRQSTADGAQAWGLEYRFSFKPQGWNRFWRAATGAWDRIFDAAGPRDPYETGNFLTLVA